MEPAAPSSLASRPGRRHLSHVEGLRAIAALVVFVNHAYAQAASGSGQQATGILAPVRLSMIAGHLAVSVFIVISGFCLTLPVVDGGDRIRGGSIEFFKRRARRILPPYYGALALSLALIFTIIGNHTGTLWDVSNLVDGKAVLAHLMLVQDLFRTGRINYAFWSIAVEWQIYFLFPLLVWGARRFGIWRATGVAMTIGYAVQFGFEDTRVHRANPHYVGLFALGMLAAYLVASTDAKLERFRRRVGWRWLAGFLLSVTTALSVFWGEEFAVLRFAYLDFLVGVMAMASLVHATSSPRSFLARFLSVKPLVFIGTFSYSVYLVHAPLLQVLWQYVLNPLKLTFPQMLVTLLTAGLGAILGIAYLFFRAFEEPFMRSPQRVPSPEDPSAAPAI